MTLPLGERERDGDREDDTDKLLDRDKLEDDDALPVAAYDPEGEHEPVLVVLLVLVEDTD